MVTRVTSSLLSHALGRTAGFSPTATKVAYFALSFFVVALAVVAVKALKSGRFQPPGPRASFAPRANGLLRLEGVDALKEQLLKIARTANGPQDGYSTILPLIMAVLEKENGIAGMKKDEEQFVYQTYQGYPYALVAVLGGKEAFNKIPTGVADQLYRLQEALNAYVKIDPKKCPIQS